MDIPGLPARKGALKLLDAVLNRGETLDQAAHNALQGVHGQADRALARALAGEALRWLTDLDSLIDSATRQILPDDAKVRSVLRLMLAGWLRLETPPHAVIATGLPLLMGGPRRLAHGVFSTLTKQAVTLPAAPTLPTPVIERWGERAGAIAAGLAALPPLDLTLKQPSETTMWAEKLGGKSMCAGHVRLQRGSMVEDLPGYAEGDWWVQDLAAGLPAALLGSGVGRTALDLCAAPGGKTMELAAEGWEVTSVDQNARRLERVSQNLERTRLQAKLVQADILTWEPDQQFDGILLDAPCTATGTCRRNPDVLHRIGQRQIMEMAEIQRQMLDRVVSWLKPGGVLVYAVCSLEPEEGEEQAVRVPLIPAPIDVRDIPTGLFPTPEGYVRTDPGMLSEQGGLDGFFIARWRKD